jgi:heat shock protein HslJ
MRAQDVAMTVCRRTATPSILASLLLVLALAALGGCTGSGGTTPDSRPLRTDVEWQLVSIEPIGRPPVTVADPSRYTVRFGSDGSVAARVDCNRCGGRYRVDGSALTVNPTLACTRAACPLPALGDQFTAALTSVGSYIQRESELELVYAGGTLRFRAAL